MFVEIQLTFKDNPKSLQKQLHFIRMLPKAWTTLLLDIELVGNFWKSQTNSDIKKFMKYHQNIFKSYNEYETLKVVAQKLSPPCPLEFWIRNSRNSVNFEARRIFKVPKFSKKYLKFLIFHQFLLSLERFLHNLQKTRYHVRSFFLMLVVLTIMRGVLGTQYRVFANCEEIHQVRANSDKILKTGHIFC